MLKSLKLILVAASLMVGLSSAFAAPIYAAECTDPASCVKGPIDELGGKDALSVNEVIKIVVQVLMFILGAISVIMIIVGGIKYTLSQGDSSAITSAKNTILYSVVGLVVALAATGIATFVLDNFSNSK